jgi:hypothetical protein
MDNAQAGVWRMHAHDCGDGRHQNFGDRWWVELHGLAYPVVEVELTEVPGDGPEDSYWGWIDAGDQDGKPTMIWQHYGIFGMQFPYGVKAEAEAGRGRAVRLEVTKVTGKE